MSSSALIENVNERWFHAAFRRRRNLACFSHERAAI
jgi:hypothetical protein